MIEDLVFTYSEVCWAFTYQVDVVTRMEKRVRLRREGAEEKAGR